MNLEELDIRSVNHNQPHITRSASNHSYTASKERISRLDNEYFSDSSHSDPDTVIKWSTPPQTPLRNSTNQQLDENIHPIMPNTMVNGSRTPPQQQIDEVNNHLTVMQAPARKPIKYDEESGSPTPVDDTPYIRFALEQLSLDVTLRQASSNTSTETYPVKRIVPREGLAQELPDVGGPSSVNIRSIASRSEVYVPLEPPIHTTRYSSLYFVPRILRPFSMIVWIFLCLLIISALLFCAIYSRSHDGLADYGAAYDGRYFVFNYLPQILGAMFYVLVECIMAAVFRVVPFAMMASDNVQQRKHAPFLGLYPRSLAFPRIDYIFRGELVVGVCSLFLWGMPLTLPLLSCVFSVGNVNGTFRYSAVQGVVWTLVIIYVFAAISLIGQAKYFFWRTTGLIWDIRSLADIIALLPRSNSLDEYQDTEVIGSKEELKRRLPLRSDRLGYWKTTNPTQDIFYCIGEEGSSTRRYTLRNGRAHKNGDVEKAGGIADMEGTPAQSCSRGTESVHEVEVSIQSFVPRYIPWFLNDIFLLLWPLSGFSLYLAVLVVSFMPKTSILHGFSPLLAANVDAASFSPANFVYSFVPSFIGLIFYIAFQAVTLAVARLTPWVALKQTSGALPERSLLVDYPASIVMPFAAISSAIGNKDYLIALLAFLNPLMLLLPVLGGGVFFPFIALPSDTLLIFPDRPVYYLLLAVLGLYIVTLALIAARILPSRWDFRLPKPVTCLAEILSFLYASEILHDAAFRAVRSKVDLRTRLVGARERPRDGRSGDLVIFRFGVFTGRDERSHLGIERVNREYHGDARSTRRAERERERQASRERIGSRFTV